MQVTINFKGIDFIIEGIYDSGEDSVMYYNDMSGHPGCAPSFEIESIFVEDSEINIFELFSWEDIGKIEELVLEEIEG